MDTVKNALNAWNIVILFTNKTPIEKQEVQQIDSKFLHVCPLIDDKLHHHISVCLLNDNGK